MTSVSLSQNWRLNMVWMNDRDTESLSICADQACTKLNFLWSTIWNVYIKGRVGWPGVKWAWNRVSRHPARESITNITSTGNDFQLYVHPFHPVTWLLLLLRGHDFTQFENYSGWFLSFGVLISWRQWRNVYTEMFVYQRLFCVTILHTKSDTVCHALCYSDVWNGRCSSVLQSCFAFFSFC